MDERPFDPQPERAELVPLVCDICGDRIHGGERTYRTWRGVVSHSDCRFGEDGP